VTAILTIVQQATADRPGTSELGLILTAQWNRPGVVLNNNLTRWAIDGTPRGEGRWLRKLDSELSFAKGASRKPRNKVLRVKGRVIRDGRLRNSLYAKQGSYPAHAANDR